ncbi:cellulose biosynthesis protein BcsD [Curvibacter sp. APW13]|uniref:cellulose biosynthesis protein BcsD n=1 Tax=Curvibacter sp. APW13 TaxID=3077236 RepID=UPI0028DEC578|nr:cellulose biosynthesis protein BcsD [Curvibacter sp. APW13]MDT8990049.1 cellulose biosynthesis protein BcsD [Curvibacter sp. APW13]
MTATPLENYYREQQMSLQWFPFLRAMAGELSEQTDAQTLRKLWTSIGERAAQDSREAFEGVNTLGALTNALNDYLARINWGVVEISEIPAGIAIDHHGAPLAEAFGDDALVWSIGFLEGFYQTLFGLLGAGPSMRVRAIEEECEALHLRFRFGR